MIYHVVTCRAAPGKEEEALRWLKALAERSNQINPRAVVKIVRRQDASSNEYFWVGRLASLADHEAGGKDFQSDPQVQAMLKEGEELSTIIKEEFFEVV